MIGAIAGDIIGSVYESHNIKTTQFPLFRKESGFTDDTVLTVALADSILHEEPFVEKLKTYYHRYPHAGYGPGFHRWAQSLCKEPYNSWGNGSAMRVSPVGFSANSLEAILKESKKSAEVTHNHPEGIKGAQATAMAIFLARSAQSKKKIKSYIEDQFNYSLNSSLDQVRENYTFDSSCQGSVPQAIIAFLESENYEDAVRKAISLGGDSDTIACITGGIAQAFYGAVPRWIKHKALQLLDDPLRQIVEEFGDRFKCL